jgi:hypothetical protein
VGRIFDIFAADFLLLNRTGVQHKGFKCKLWRLGQAEGVDCGSNGGAVRLLLTQVVVGIWIVLLRSTEPTQMLPCREEVFKPPVIVHDAVDDPSAGAHDLGRQ